MLTKDPEIRPSAEKVLENKWFSTDKTEPLPFAAFQGYSDFSSVENNNRITGMSDNIGRLGHGSGSLLRQNSLIRSS